MTVRAEGELTVAWGWVLVGTALSQVIGAPIAAGGRQHTSGACIVASAFYLRSQSSKIGLKSVACKLALKVMAKGGLYESLFHSLATVL